MLSALMFVFLAIINLVVSIKMCFSNHLFKFVLSLDVYFNNHLDILCGCLFLAIIYLHVVSTDVCF